MKNVHPRLVVLSGPLKGETIELKRDRYTIGRSEDCDIRIEDGSISTHHASLLRDAQGGYSLTDEQSTNGTLVDNAEITSLPLHAQARLSLGSVELRYETAVPASAPRTLPQTLSSTAATGRQRVADERRRRHRRNGLAAGVLMGVALVGCLAAYHRSPGTVSNVLSTAPLSAQSGPGLSVEGMPLGEEYPYLSPLAMVLSKDGNTLHAIQHTGRLIATIDLASGQVVRSIALGGAPHGLALDDAGERLFVTHGLNDGQVDVINPGDGSVLFTLPAGHTPVSPVVSADGKTLFVCNRFNDEVAVFNLETRQLETRIPVTREPVAAARGPGGTILVVANHLPAQPSNSPHVASKVDLIDMQTRQVTASILLPNGSASLRDVCVSPDDRYAYITHSLSRFTLPTTQLERGWMNTSALSIIDLQAREWLTTVLLDDVDLGAANPWGVTCSADGARIYVAHSGTSELSVIDRAGLHERLARLAGGEAVSQVSKTLRDVPNDLSFLLGLRRRVRLPGDGPRGVTAVRDGVMVAQYFSDNLVWVHAGTGRDAKVETVSLAEDREPNQIRQGEMAFFDARLCFQNWQSCASCHPDVRADALNWDLLNDGIGNPKNTRTMLYSHETPPVMITGIRAQAEVAVRAGFRFIQFTVVPESTAVAADEYMKALRPVPSPRLVDGAFSEAALRGRAVFEKANCATCHAGPYFTNGRKYDVGIGPDELGIREFVTPPLVEVWRTAPYLYDGRAATMREVLTKYNPEDKHGRTSSLSEREIDDLAEYVLSL